MNQSLKIEPFWQQYVATLSEEDRQNLSAYLVDDFADTPKAATRVGKLVRDGIKTTSSSLLWALEHEGIPLPKAGDISVVVDGDGDPLCVIEMTEVEIRPFHTVDEQFAFEYGEGERTLAYWLSDNWEYHSRACREIGREPSETMPVVFMRFRLLYPQRTST
jgi:uncharacterized protein YhfF